MFQATKLFTAGSGGSKAQKLVITLGIAVFATACVQILQVSSTPKNP